jgi:GrpB-like predicted nucleotidyltransferase (UPF0157 family)
VSVPETFELAGDDVAARAAAERLFASIRAELAGMLPASADIRHIGATSVPGCLTKGDLDIVVRIDRHDFPPADRALEARFERNLGSVRSASFAAFEDRGAIPHLGIQLVAIGSSYDDFHRFAEALRADPELMRAYNRLKKAWHGKPMDDYRAAKDAFIAGVMKASDPLQKRSRS